MIVAAVLVAAGSGERLGAGVPKAFVDLGARTLLEHAVDRFAGHPRIRDLVVAAPPEHLARAGELAAGAVVVAGGDTRQRSVSAALATLAEDVDTVLVHDVARPLVPAELIDRVLDALLTDGVVAAVPAMPVADTIRRTDPASGELAGLVDRSRLLAMQTPQAFVRSVLVEAHRAADGADATDDAALVESIGARVVAVRGDQRALKITAPVDLVLAEAMLTHYGAAR